MITNDEYERDLRWVTKQIHYANKRGDLCSPVTEANVSPMHAHSYILRVRRNNLYLEGRTKTYLRVPLNQVSDVIWQKGGSFLKLNFEVDARRYCLQIYAPASIEILKNNFPQNWFELIVMFLFRRSRFAPHARSFIQGIFKVTSTKPKNGAPFSPTPNFLMQIQNPEPRFYPSYPMRIDDFDAWRAMDRGKRSGLCFAYNDEIRQLLIERVQDIHPDWGEEQQRLMFFKLSYKGENFEMFSAAKIKRGDFTEAEVEAVRVVPIPTEREDALRYAGISHPMLDESQMTWPEN